MSSVPILGLTPVLFLRCDQRKIIRILHVSRVVQIEKSVTRVTVRHHEACRLLLNMDQVTDLPIDTSNS